LEATAPCWPPRVWRLHAGIPILPINMGSLGFLTSFHSGRAAPGLDDTLEGHYSLSERIMISVELGARRQGDR